MMKATAELIKTICIFCIAHKGRCFEGWEAGKIYRFFAWHLLANQLIIHKEHGRIEGVAVCWSGIPEDFYRKEKLKEPQFNWDFVPEGNALMISVIFGKREVVQKLWAKIVHRWPNCTRVFMYRRKAGESGEVQVLREISPAFLERFIT